jgi:cytochrome c oxidase subunit IV
MPERVISRGTYLIVCAALVVLTGTTVGLAYVDLGGWNTVVALAIAAAKAILIVLFFMEARYSRGLVRLVIVGALLWLGILIVGTMDDVVTRGWLAVPGR